MSSNVSSKVTLNLIRDREDFIENIRELKPKEKTKLLYLMEKEYQFYRTRVLKTYNSPIIYEWAILDQTLRENEPCLLLHGNISSIRGNYRTKVKTFFQDIGY